MPTKRSKQGGSIDAWLLCRVTSTCQPSQGAPDECLSCTTSIHHPPVQQPVFPANEPFLPRSTSPRPTIPGFTNLSAPFKHPFQGSPIPLNEPRQQYVSVFLIRNSFKSHEVLIESYFWKDYSPAPANLIDFFKDLQLKPQVLGSILQAQYGGLP